MDLLSITYRSHHLAIAKDMESVFRDNGRNYTGANYGILDSRK